MALVTTASSEHRMEFPISVMACGVVFVSVLLSLLTGLTQSSVNRLRYKGGGLRSEVRVTRAADAVEVNTTATLAGVLKEYLDDIETVELAVSKCATGHRNHYREATAVLETALDNCGARGRRNVGTTCVEDKTRRTVSDVRQHITALKNCVDTF